ncbi:hypothetical protein GCM10009414_27390 [Tatumella terrea]|uniref:DUF7661 family protein n=1 Tax=Tatumella terrea TaxID=419007 RepID=UPI0031E1FDCA
MLIYSVFGRYIGVRREQDRWLVFRIDMAERKYSRLRECVIPDTLTEDEIPRWLDDIFHESATEKHPEVIRIE